MRAKQKQNKKLVNFRFDQQMIGALERESGRTGLTKTKIIERALERYFAVKQ